MWKHAQTPMRRILSVVSAAALGLVPVVMVAAPAHADPGDFEISSDLESVEGDVFSFELKRLGGANLPAVTLKVVVVAGDAPGVTIAEAPATSDLTPIDTTTTFAAGNRTVTKKFNVQTLDDALNEDVENFKLQFRDTVTDDLVTEAYGIIDDNDEKPSYSLTVTDPVGEGASNTVVTANLNVPSGRTVTIPYTTPGTTATAGVDYAGGGGNIVIPAGDTQKTTTVGILEDLLDEDDETFSVVGGNAPNANKVQGATSRTVHITDNDQLPEVSIGSPANEDEGTQLSFPVTLDAMSGRAVKVHVKSTDVSATGGADYTAYDAEVTIPAGQMSVNVDINTSTDTLDEVDPETFTMTLSGLVNASPGLHQTATGTIDDDDDAPVATLTPTAVTEGTTGSVNKEFDVTLDAPSGREVAVGYSVTGSTATQGVDFEAVTSGTLTFAPGDTVKKIIVPVIGDRIDEGAGEDFIINLTNNGGTVGGASTLGPLPITITDDDNLPTLSQLNSVTMAEGDGAGVANFLIKLSNPSANPITLDVATTDVSADDGPVNAAGDGDYDPVTTTITIPAGDDSKQIPVTVNGDEVFEGDETAKLSVTVNGSETDAGGTIPDATLTLTNDDDPPTIALSQQTKPEGDQITLSATLTGVAQDDIVVDIALTGGTGNGLDPADVGDFDATPLTPTIPGGDHGSTPVTLGTVALTADTIDENAESLLATLSDPGQDLATVSALQTIDDDQNDVPPTFAISAQTFDEADGQVGVEIERVFTGGVTASERDMSVHYATADGSATDGSDYEETSDTLAFTKGDPADKTFPLEIEDDGTFERDETFTVNLTNAAGTTISGASAAMTITDDDSGNKPTFSIAAPVVAPVEGVATTANVTITVSPAPTQDIDFEITADDVTATRGAQFTGDDDFAVPATKTYPAGATSVTVPVTIKDDTVYEGNETATIKVKRAVGEDDAAGGEQSATLTIQDNEAKPSVVLTAADGVEGGAPVAVSANVTGVAQRPIPVTVTAMGAVNVAGTAAGVGDFDATGLNIIEIPAGDHGGLPVALGTIALTPDTVDEYDETVKVTLTSAGVLTSPVNAFLTITDELADATPTIVIVDTPIAESGPDAEVEVKLDFGQGNGAATTEKTLGVHYATANGTALAGSDYTTKSGDLSFAPGDTTHDVVVPINDDNLYELTEAFTVNLTSPTGTTISDAAATVTITDNDGSNKPTFSVSSAPAGFREGTPGTYDFTVTMSPMNTQNVDFTVAVDPGTATQTAGAGRDDYATPSGTLRINANAGTGVIHVTVKNDGVYEPTELATLKVALAQGEVDADGPAVDKTMTITDDDAAPTVALVGESGAEGTDLLATAKVIGVAQSDMTFDLAFTGDSSPGNDPAETQDYANSNEQATIPAGTADGSMLTFRTFRINNDTIDEPVESIRLVATNTLNQVASEPQFYKINDDVNDVPPSVTVNNLTVGEGDGTAHVPVTLNFPSSGDTTATEQTVVVNLATADDTAYEPLDYTLRAGSLTFVPGTMSRDFDVTVANDLRNEDSETFTVAATSATPAGTPIAMSTGTVTITDNDQNVARPAFDVADVRKVEGSANSTATFTVELDGPAADDVTFTVVAADGSARDAGAGVGNNDYNPPSAQTLTIDEGDISGTIGVPVNGDLVHEGDEDMTVTVALATGERDAVGIPVPAKLTIEDDDAVPTVQLTNGSGNEGDEVALAGTLFGSTEVAFDVNLAFSGDNSGVLNPAEAEDYDTTKVIHRIPAGAATGAVVNLGSLTLDDDTVDEVTETVKAVSGAHSATYRIFDDSDDVPPSVTVNDLTVDESDGTVHVPVTLDFPAGGETTATEQTIQVQLATSNDTALSPSDYLPASGSLTFPPTVLSKDFDVTVVNDVRNEDAETFKVTATSATPQGTPIAVATGTVTITDNDGGVERPGFSVADVSKTEGNANAMAELTVALDSAAADDVSFTVATADGSARDGGAGVGSNDYDPPTALTLTIGQGDLTGVIRVPVIGDTVHEGDEDLTVTVALAAGERDAVGEPVPAMLTIEDDDAKPTVQLTNGSGPEGDQIALPATVFGSTEVAVDADLTFAGDGAGALNAAEAEDFETSSVNYEIPAGTANNTPISLGSLTLNDDFVDEPQETVRATSGTRTATFKINDDPNDVPPTVVIGDENIVENLGSVDLTIRLEFENDTDSTDYDVVVPWNTANTTAGAGSDYTTRSGSVTIQAGSTEEGINVPILDDQLYENDESFQVRLGVPQPSVVKVGDGTAIVTIEEDDEPSTTLVAPTVPPVGAGVVTLTGRAGQNATVKLYAAPVSAPTSFKLLQSATATLSGAFTFKPSIAVGTRFYAFSNGASSPIRVVQITQAPTITGVSGPVAGAVTLTVKGNPIAAGQAVQFQQSIGGVWKTVTIGKLSTAGTSVATIRALRSGTAFNFRAIIPATASLGILSGTTATIKVTAR